MGPPWTPNARWQSDVRSVVTEVGMETMEQGEMTNRALGPWFPHQSNGVPASDKPRPARTPSWRMVSIKD